MGERYGQYIHSPGFVARRTFEGGRTLSIVLADATVAGITGYEHNGIVVLDEDNKHILLDGHLRRDSNWGGPSREQINEFRRLCAMDWDRLTAFCRSHPRYRTGVAEDVDVVSQPQEIADLDRIIRDGTMGTPGPDIRTRDMIAADKAGIPMPLKTREDMLVFLARHHMHGERGRGFVAWDIKVRSFDASGKGGSEPVDPKFDKRWDEYVAKSEHLFGDCCESALREYFEGAYSTYPGRDGGDYKFGTSGRSGGHLVLTSWKGPQPGAGDFGMQFASHGDYVDWLKELEPADLARFYKLVANVDHDVRNPEAELAYQYNQARWSIEQDWGMEADEDAAPSIKA